MRIVHTIDALREAVREAKDKGERIGFVPTMGALHHGHGELIARSVSAGDWTVVSIFVNPLQFGPNEDFHRYPRTLEADTALAEQEGAHIVFAPSAEEMYPGGPPQTTVEVTGLTDRLCGASRPGHFHGVTTVVAKLFHIVQPHRAYFGEKDFQQLAVIRRMVTDLNMPVQIVAVPTVREPDGLATSSRNRYLNGEERQAAAAIPTALTEAARQLQAGVRDPHALRGLVLETLARQPLIRVDYVEVVDATTLIPLSYIGDGADGPKRHVLVAVAVFIGKTRLIDNLHATIGE